MKKTRDGQLSHAGVDYLVTRRSGGFLGYLLLITYYLVTRRWGRFYRNVQKKRGNMVRDPSSVRDVIPLEDYLFRHDRGSFWMASYKVFNSNKQYIYIYRYVLLRRCASEPIVEARSCVMCSCSR